MGSICAKSYIRKKSAFLIGMLLAFAVFFALLIPAAETVHECSGEDCPICECIAMCEQLIRKLSTGETPVAAVRAIPMAEGCIAPAGNAADVLPASLVLWKVRLDD